MKKISWKTTDNQVTVGYYRDDAITRMTLGHPKASQIQVDPNEWGSTPQAFVQSIKSYCAGALVQDAFPTVPTDIREFFMSGVTPQEQKRFFTTRDES